MTEKEAKKCAACGHSIKCPECWCPTDRGCWDTEADGECPGMEDYICMKNGCDLYDVAQKDVKGTPHQLPLTERTR